MESCGDDEARVLLPGAKASTVFSLGTFVSGTLAAGNVFFARFGPGKTTDDPLVYEGSARFLAIKVEW